MSLKVVVVGKNYNTTLGIIKSVGEAGYRCEVVACVGSIPKHPTPDVISKYVDSYAYAMFRNDNDIIKKLMNYADTSEKKILIPADDYSASLFDRNYNKLHPFFTFPTVNNIPGELTRLMNKARQKELASSMGIKAAKIREINLNKEYVVPSNLEFPCFAKPIGSNDVPASKTFIAKCDNKEALEAHLQRAKENGLNNILIEEFIPFTEEFTIPGLAIGDDIIIPAYIKKIKTATGKHKGVTIIGTVHEIEPRIKRQLQEFVLATKYCGIFDIEVFILDGNYYFNEINLRSSAAGYAVTAAGVNLPGIYCAYLNKLQWKGKTHIVHEGMSFLNEKADLQEYKEGLCTWKQLRKDIKSVDVCFMTDNNDPMARAAFTRMMRITRLLKMKHSIRIVLEKYLTLV